MFKLTDKIKAQIATHNEWCRIGHKADKEPHNPWSAIIEQMTKEAQHIKPGFSDLNEIAIEFLGQELDEEDVMQQYKLSEGDTEALFSLWESYKILRQYD